MKRYLLAIVLILLTSSAYCKEITFKQKAELFIMNGKVIKSAPVTYVTLDIQKDKVIYKTVSNQRNKTRLDPYVIFQIISEDNTFITTPEPLWMVKIKEIAGSNKLLKQETVIRAFCSEGKSVGFLIIGETFLLEVKNSIFFGNATNYAYYEKIND